MKKNLQLTALAVAMGIASLTAQTGRMVGNPAPGTLPTSTEAKVFYPNRGCGTGVPGIEWENQFQEQIKAYLASHNDLNNGKVQTANYTIPVIIHVIHTGQATGTFPNIQQGQLNSQVAVLNADYGGTGFNVGNYPATAFQSYASSTVALSASLTAANKDGSGRVAIANTNVQFCLALKDTLGNVLVEPGIHRVNATTLGALTGTFTSKDPANAAYSNPTKFMDFIDNYIKKNTIWNVSKYLNIWVTDEQAAVGLLGYATFPPGSGNTGLSAPFGSSTTDGFWAYAKAFGSNTIFPGGTYDPTYNKGRTCTHEIGHWLGLRHIWGDGGQCGATDYCVDTPPQKGTTGPPAGCYYGTPAYPQQANTCTRPDGPASASVKNLNGDMFMNFMDYTDDVAMYMFTVDQTTRIQTTMLNSPYRKLLGTHGLCSLAASSPTANFTIAGTGCTGSGITVSNTSGGSPSPTYVWSTNPSTGVTYNPNNTATNPQITFANPGTYTVSVAATNSVGTSNFSQTTVISICSTPCNDTLTNFNGTDTLYNIGSSNGGYVGGNNGYGDLEKAEYYSSTGLVGNSKIVGGIVLFYRHATANVGTKGTSNVVFKVYNGNNTTGPAGAAINTFTATLTNILASATATSGVQYCGNPGLAFTSNIIRPYSFNFASPTNITADFLMGVQLPTVTGDTAAIFFSSTNGRTASTAWELQTGPAWYPFDDGTSATWGIDASLAILPKIACVTGVYNPNGISSNIAVFPNPSNGQFNFAVTMPQSTDLQFTVINSIGQVVYAKTEKGIMNGIIGLDLSHLAKGVYNVCVTDNNGDKAIKKLIIQ